MRNIDPGLEVIKEFEGFSAKPYLCSAKVPTIGYGSTYYPDGSRVTLKDEDITKEYATDCLRYHVKKDCKYLEKFLSDNNITLNDNQFSALISFIYNCGIGTVLTPGRSVHEALKLRSNLKMGQALMLFTRANVRGKREVVSGLVRRRKAELALYSK